MSHRLSLRKKSPSGFTLIELLVVIAVISILAAILFPVFARARENARRASCQSNLKQIGLGLLQYTQDYDEQMIADWYGTTGSPLTSDDANYKWMDASYSYIKSVQIFVCPSDSADTVHKAKYIFHTDLDGIADAEQYYGSYVINHGYGASIAGRTPAVSHPMVVGSAHQFVNQAAAQQPSETAWVMDAKASFSLNIANDTLSIDSSTDPRTMENAKERHLSTINTLFVDGHVKAVKLEYLNEQNGSNVFKHFTMEDD